MVIRTGKGKIIPYKNAIIDISESSKIYIGDGDLEFGCNKLKGSKKETLIRLNENSIWSALGGCKISYGGTIELLQSALFEHGYFTMNANSVIISAKHIAFGNDVMLARNVIIFDSDFHPLITNGEPQQIAEEVTIEDHVWVGANAIVLKGTIIKNGSVVAANTLLSGKIETNQLVASENTNVILKQNIQRKR